MACTASSEARLVMSCRRASARLVVLGLVGLVLLVVAVPLVLMLPSKGCVAAELVGATPVMPAKLVIAAMVAAPLAFMLVAMPELVPALVLVLVLELALELALELVLDVLLAMLVLLSTLHAALQNQKPAASTHTLASCCRCFPVCAIAIVTFPCR